MKNLVLRYGLYATAITVGIPFLMFLIMGKGDESDYKLGEIIGYSTILLSMIFVFLGIKKYRDENNGGNISFWEALKIGILIAAIPSIAFGLYNLLYIEFLDPEFMDKYYQYYMDEAQATMNSIDFEAMKTKIEGEKEAFQKPVVQFGAMFITVFLIGFIVSLISSMILKRDENVLETSN